MGHCYNGRLFDWRAGLVAIVLMASDQTVLERARLLRNDYAAEFFALLAFWLYDVAERRGQARFYVGAGLAAGCGVMCHSSILYLIAAVLLLMLMRDGWRLFKQSKLYLFLASAFGALAGSSAAFSARGFRVGAEGAAVTSVA